MWLKLQDSASSTPLYIAVCYAPPEGSSTYANSSAINPIEELSLAVAAIQGLGGEVLIGGDFNARTGIDSDSAPVSSHDPAVDMFLDDHEPVWQKPSSLPVRVNQDKTKNNFGKQLLQLCRESGMLILNGRVKGDLQGRCTCQGSSTVDYFLVSPNLFNHDVCLTVVDDVPDSDHSPVSCTLCLAHTAVSSTGELRASTTKNTADKPPQLRFSAAHVDEYRVLLQAFLNDYQCHPDIDIHAVDIQNVIVNAATLAFGTRKPAKPGSFPCNPWYDEECKSLRKRLQHALQVGDPCGASLRKQYKSLTKRKKANYTFEQAERLCKLAKESPASFWRAVHGPKQHVLNSISACQWREAFEGLYSCGSDHAPPLSQGVQPPSPPVNSEPARALDNQDMSSPSVDSPLDHDITESEVVTALAKLRLRKAPGVDGITSELLLSASEVLVPPLTHLFNHIFAGKFPECLSAGVIHPIFKKGDPNDPQNYRGITICSTITKLYASILDNRIHEWAESSGVRARGQAGFRRDRGTIDNIFILRTLLDQRQNMARMHPSHQPQKLFTCFVDFKKAFDSVPRPVLWEVLAKAGVSTRILNAIKAMYDKDTACVWTPDGLTDKFDCNIGVKQGCPLSPNLFGLYLDDLEKILLSVPNHDAPMLAGLAVPLLLYADDLALISTSRGGLQRLLNELEAFCTVRGLTVNIDKTKVVVFGSRAAMKEPVTYNNVRIEQVISFRYLGLELHQSGTFQIAVAKLLESARRATFALHSRCSALHIKDPKLKCSLFDALVYPIMAYGSEVWSPGTVIGEELEKWHRKFMRSILRLPSNSVCSMVYGELGRSPLQHRWHKQVLRFWNRLLSTPNELLKAAFVENSRMSQLAPSPGQAVGTNWCSQVERLILHFAAPGPLSVYEDLDVRQYSEMFFRSFRHAALSSESHMSVYYRMFKQRHVYSAYLSEVHNVHLRVLLTRFRSGCHWLAVNEGRYSGIPRDQRVCPHCPSVVEDEHHFLLQCPAYSCLRDKYHVLDLVPTRSVADLFSNCSDSVQLAKFMTQCREIRGRKLKDGI